jgi:hypothetical protein
MVDNPADREVPQLRRLQEWWLELPLSYRVNALLYLGGGLLVVFLLITLLGGGDSTPRQIQVGAGSGATTTAPSKPATPAAPATTVAGASTSSSTSTTGPTTTTTRFNLAAAQAAATPQYTPPSGTNGGTSGGGSSTPDTSAPAEPTTTTTVGVQPCRNSQESRCGDFSWDPQPAQNQPLTVQVVVKTMNPKVGQPVTFEVTVIDPDHLVSDYCSQVRYGDGGNADGGCSPSPPECPPHFGPWTPPERQNGTYTHQYTRTYTGAGTFRATFTFRSRSAQTCLGMDPYASENSHSVDVTVAP